MVRLSVTSTAERDVRDILTSLAKEAGYSVASRYAGDFKAAYRFIAEFPEAGAPPSAQEHPIC